MPLLRLGIPLVAGLSAAHGLVPPHPGPLAAIERLGADTGRTLFYSLIVALPVAMMAGPLIGRLISRRVHAGPGAMAEQFTGPRARAARTPSLAITLLTILMPVLLMLLAALAQIDDAGRARCGDGSCSPAARSWRCCWRRCWRSTPSAGPAASIATRLLRFAEESLPPIAGVLLVVGAGGGFGRVLVDGRRRQGDRAGRRRLAAVAARARLGDRGAAALSVGSATVRVVTAASIMAPMVAAMPNVNKELLVVVDRRRLADRVARQRRRVLAGEGVLQHERAADAGHVDGARDDRRRSRGLAGVLLLGLFVG